MTAPRAFCITADLDWASETCIALLLDALEKRRIVPTVFVTHTSPEVAKRASRGMIHVGVHPNFLPGSTHGVTARDVVTHVMALHPRALASRSHCYYETSGTAELLAEAGVLYDSNLLLYLQPDIRPLWHASGLLKLPAFWGDGQAMRARTGQPWDAGLLERRLLTPGLKIFNIHPFNFAFNVTGATHYERLKAFIPIADPEIIARDASSGEGCQTFFLSVVDRILDAGCTFDTLHALYERHLRDSAYGPGR